MFKTLILDDIVDETQQNIIFNRLMSSKWNFLNDVSGVNSEYPSYGFVHMLKHPNHGITSELYETISVPIINNIINKINLKIDDIYYNRSFLQLPLNEKYIKEHNGVHVDLPMDHIACVYYCNDSDGDTIIYEQTMKEISGGTTGVELKEHNRVFPKKGRIVLFDGSRYHCSSQPKNNLRCIINFDLI